MRRTPPALSPTWTYLKEFCVTFFIRCLSWISQVLVAKRFARKPTVKRWAVVVAVVVVFFPYTKRSILLITSWRAEWVVCVLTIFFFLVNRCMADWNTFPEDFLCIIKYRAYNNLFTRWMVKILRMCSYSFFLAAKQNTEWYTRNVTTSFSLAGEGLSSVCVSWNFLLFTERYVSCVTTAFLSLPGGGLVGRHVAWQLLPCQQVKGWAVRMCNNSKDPK